MVLFVVTLLIRLLDLDLRLATHFWSAEDGWSLGRDPVVQFLYRHGTWAALAAGLGGGALYALSRMVGRWRETRRLGLFLALLLILGPGVVVNTILKEHVPRPRPVNTVEFGGEQPFRAVGQFWLPGSGHSFPSGHASMGFYWLGLFVYFWPYNRSWAWAFGALGGLHGGWMGFGRMAQGGHWPSDILWSAGSVYLTAWALQAALVDPPRRLARLHRGLKLGCGSPDPPPARFEGNTIHTPDIRNSTAARSQ
jgi:lipid A 4'-phosphatase